MLSFQQKEKILKKYLEVLKKCPLFREIEEENLLRMLTCLGARIEHVEKRSTVFAEGDPAIDLGIVLSGGMQLEQIDYYGNRSILAGVGPSELFAEAFACAEIPAIPVSVVATKDSEVMLLSASHVLHTCENGCGFHQQLIYNLMKDLATKTLLFHERVEITSKRSTREKLLAYLSLEAKRAGHREFDIPFDRQELADYLDVDRSGLSAEIGKLRREGVLTSNKRHFVLL